MKNWREPPQWIIQQCIIGGIVLGVFLAIQKRVAQAFSRGGIVGTLEAKALQVRPASTLLDIGNGWPIAGDLVAHVALAVDNLAVSGGIGDAIANGRRPGVQRPLDIASKDHHNLIAGGGLYRFRRQGQPEQKQNRNTRNRWVK